MLLRGKLEVEVGERLAGIPVLADLARRRLQTLTLVQLFASVMNQVPASLLWKLETVFLCVEQVNVSGKVVFLTGGAGGLARALASLLLTRGAK